MIRKPHIEVYGRYRTLAHVRERERERERESSLTKPPTLTTTPSFSARTVMDVVEKDRTMYLPYLEMWKQKWVRLQGWELLMLTTDNTGKGEHANTTINTTTTIRPIITVVLQSKFSLIWSPLLQYPLPLPSLPLSLLQFPSPSTFIFLSLFSYEFRIVWFVFLTVTNWCFEPHKIDVNGNELGIFCKV